MSVAALLRQCLGWLTGSAPLSNRELGNRGEAWAARQLRRQGYRVVARNFRAAGAEIDLVAFDGATLVFIEVKLRRSLGAGSPGEAVTFHKQRRLRRAAAIFADRRGLAERPMRFDVMGISRSGRRWQFDLIKDAF
jgi:putative endonuclease